MDNYEDDPSDSRYSIFTEKGKLIVIRNTCDEIKQITENSIDPGGICYILSQLYIWDQWLKQY